MKVLGVVAFISVFVHLAVSAEEVEDTDCFDSYEKCNDVIDFCSDDQVNDVMYSICKKTCRMCKKPEPERKEQEGCFDININCNTVIDVCKSDTQSISDLMHQQCRKSCGFCEQPTEGTVGCMDESLDCPSVIGSCNTTNVDLKNLLYRRCVKTCEFCKKPEPVVEDPKVEEECVDASDKCKHVLDMCNSEAISDVMHQECRKSCGLCGKPKPEVEPIPETPIPVKPKKPNHKKPKKPTHLKPKPKSQPSKGSCVDTIPHCARIQDLCHSKEAYIKADMMKKCRKFCGFCGKQQIKQHLEIPPAGK